MTTDELVKSSEELEKKIKDTNEQIRIADERTRMAKVNQTDYKFSVAAVFGVLAYVIIYFILGVTKALPANIVPATILGGSIVTGVIGTTIINKVFRIKERLRNFSNAKTNEEKLEEEFRYAIELEKINSRNQAIRETIENLKANHELLSSLSNRYNINDKNAPRNSEDARNNINELLALLKIRNQELDVLSTQRVLHDKAGRLRETVSNVMESTLFTMLGGIMTMLFVMMPFFLVSGSVAIGAPFVFGSLFAGLIGTGTYLYKRNANILNVFTRINNSLEEDKLPILVKETYQEVKDINQKMQDKMREISVAELELQEQKRALEAFTEGDDYTDSETKDRSLEEELTLPPQSHDVKKDTPKKLTLSHEE